ncbi:hypothetical protein BOTBODRAFT_29049 [Botryobasidium botryosum FD-172 SS1]|uniref:Uncharacterized protein n=1 Tax=Botryobasidium botryosum (strain FD-172 SS1) TaxID=930990 RepID=A0A067MVD8_BOTB1|nr:hypothetical protein BOTBODRAFT_29049 [Botryobasidium botryosum FD-172 SS1]
MEPSNLEVPRPEKNFLISPPGSPPVGWEPIEEDPPNTMTLAQDLIHALERLELQKEWGSDRSNGVEVLMQPPEGEEGLSIFVQDFSGGADQGDGMITPVEVVEYVRGGGQGSGIGMVKATVESFGVGERPSVGRLPTTPMPPR